ncbi:MAG: helix-turn-helix domain-containing protein [Rhodanobacter sp.]
MNLLERTPAMQTIAMTSPSEGRSDSADGLALRIRQLIELEGSAAAIAERCGFSAGAVRNWRDGHSDISRERCITLARALDISLLWLVTGEGPMKGGDKDTPRSAATPPSMQQPHPDEDKPAARRNTGLDPGLLAAALRLLQSYIGLVGGSLDPASRADLLAELYDILGHADDTTQTDRLVTFHHRLVDQLRRNRTLIA